MSSETPFAPAVVTLTDGTDVTIRKFTRYEVIENTLHVLAVDPRGEVSAALVVAPGMWVCASVTENVGSES